MRGATRRSRSPASSSSVAARAAERAVSGRRRPGSRRRAGRGRAARRARPRPASRRAPRRPRRSTCLRARPARAARPAERRVGDQRRYPSRRSARRRRRGARGRRRRSAQPAPRRSARARAPRPADARFTFADADARHEPVVHEPGERADRRPPRRPRVGSVEEVEVDRQAVECLEAGLAVGADSLRAAVGDPGRRRPRHAALRHDPRARAARRSRAERGRAAARCGRAPPPSPYARAVSNTVIPAPRRRPRSSRARAARSRRPTEPHAAEPDAQPGARAIPGCGRRPTPPHRAVRRPTVLDDRVWTRRGLRVTVTEWRSERALPCCSRCRSRLRGCCSPISSPGASQDTATTKRSRTATCGTAPCSSRSRPR